MTFDVIIFLLILIGIPILIIFFIFILWRKGGLSRLFSIIFLILPFSLFTYALIMDLAFSECGLSYDYAEKRIIEILKEEGLNTEKLVSTGREGTCMYYFEYNSGEIKKSYIVQSTWIHGVKVHYINE